MTHNSFDWCRGTGQVSEKFSQNDTWKLKLLNNYFDPVAFMVQSEQGAVNIASSNSLSRSVFDYRSRFAGVLALCGALSIHIVSLSCMLAQNMHTCVVHACGC